MFAISASAIRSRAVSVIDEHASRFQAISAEIWADPEIGFEEHRAQARLVEPLKQAGFALEVGVAGMPTAFRATWQGTGPGPTIAVLSEYDALKGIGHACGHNLIGTAGVLAGWAVRQAWPDLPGRVLVLGTPAEEGGNGKIIMVNAGVFNDVDAALMFHPTAGDDVVHRNALAFQELTITFRGQPSHAAAGPWEGLNALDAMIQTFVNIGLLRQQLRPDARIHGVITRGGDAANVIPELTEAHFMVRAEQVGYLEEIKAKVLNCARAGALATGTEVSFQEGLLCHNRINNMVMARRFQSYVESQGITVSEPDPKAGLGSSDIGNVSRVCPSIHPYVSIAPLGVRSHSAEFREASGSPEGYAAMFVAAKALAMTTIDLLADPSLLAAAKAELAEALAQGR